MLVDDNRDAGDTLASDLGLLGHDVTIAAGGREALGLLTLRANWDAFILDIGIAPTGYGQQHDEAESRAAGFHHHLVKPVDVDRIAALLVE